MVLMAKSKVNTFDLTLGSFITQHLMETCHICFYFSGMLEASINLH